MEPHTTFDFSELDSEAELLAEELKLTPEQAQRVLLWKKTQDANDTRRSQAEQLSRVCQFFLAEGQNARLAAVALCFAANLTGKSNGSQCETQQKTSATPLRKLVS